MNVALVANQPKVVKDAFNKRIVFGAPVFLPTEMGSVKLTLKIMVQPIVKFETIKN